MTVNMKINEKSLKKLGLKLINIRKPSKKNRESSSKSAINNDVKAVTGFQPPRFQPSSVLPMNMNNLNTEIARQQLQYYENLNKNTPAPTNVPFIPNTNKLKDQLEQQEQETLSSYQLNTDIENEPTELSYRQIYDYNSGISSQVMPYRRINIKKEENKDISSIPMETGSVVNPDFNTSFSIKNEETPQSNTIEPQPKMNIITRENTFENSSVVPVNQIKREPFINYVDDDLKEDDEKEDDDEKADDIKTLIDEPFEEDETIPIVIKSEKADNTLSKSQDISNISSLSKKDIDDSIQRSLMIRDLRKKYKGYLSLYRASNESLISDYEFLSGRRPPNWMGRVALQKEIKELIKKSSL